MKNLCSLSGLLKYNHLPVIVTLFISVIKWESALEEKILSSNQKLTKRD
jgi:hypothetical protein